jgi:hypothetical protein
LNSQSDLQSTYVSESSDTKREVHDRIADFHNEIERLVLREVKIDDDEIDEDEVGEGLDISKLEVFQSLSLNLELYSTNIELIHKYDLYRICCRIYA